MLQTNISQTNAFEKKNQTAINLKKKTPEKWYAKVSCVAIEVKRAKVSYGPYPQLVYGFDEVGVDCHDQSGRVNEDEARLEVARFQLRIMQLTPETVVLPKCKHKDQCHSAAIFSFFKSQNNHVFLID